MNTKKPPQEETQLVVHRHLRAQPEEIFALLTDPARHHQTEPGDWVGEAIDPAPVTHLDQVFSIRMFHVNAGGHYRMDNRVIALEADRTIAWEPGQYDDDGRLVPGGWAWRYDLLPTNEGTEVTLTYDWSGVPAAQRSEFGLPPFGPEFLEESLATLAKALQSPAE